MKSIKILLVLFSLGVMFTACENYSDTPVEYSPIFPLSGEWRVRITDESTGDLLKTTAGAVAIYVFGTYNTSDNKANEMWIRTTSSMVGGLGALRGKISCDVPGLSFGGTNVSDISVTTGATFSITDGKVSLNAITMPSGVTADKISFRLTTSKVAGKTFLFEGFRRTLWNEDESYSSF
ncbi:MAG: hypothetical protein LBU22_05545 [Dysgonamonadaceae bacterium]|jgi:hypothetical protein|nr:hypothetical protein [Dysgonamonadaceae bacterium]